MAFFTKHRHDIISLDQQEMEVEVNIRGTDIGGGNLVNWSMRFTNLDSKLADLFRRSSFQNSYGKSEFNMGIAPLTSG